MENSIKNNYHSLKYSDEYLATIETKIKDMLELWLITERVCYKDIITFTLGLETDLIFIRDYYHRMQKDQPIFLSILPIPLPCKYPINKEDKHFTNYLLSEAISKENFCILEFSRLVMVIAHYRIMQTIVKMINNVKGFTEEDEKEKLSEIKDRLAEFCDNYKIPYPPPGIKK